MAEEVPAELVPAEKASAGAAVCFYKRSGLASTLVRWDTRRPGQAWGDVPSHCAIVLTVGGVQMLYEMISTGWSSRPATTDDLSWAYRVALPNSEAAIAFAWSQRGMRYDWLTILIVALARLLPGRFFKGGHRRYTRVCSWFVEQCLVKGGWPEPMWAWVQYLPLSPNDVLRAVRETAALPESRS